MPTKDRKIHPVNDNTDKYNTYKINLSKYEKALKYRFYYEALLIVYAMIEDRLRSMLYHMAFFYNSKATTIWKKTRQHFSTIVKSYLEPNENEDLNVNSISGKIKIIRCVIRWAHNTTECYAGNRYLSTLMHQCENIDIENTFQDLNSWREYRNEITHSLLNKNMYSVNDNIVNCVKKGMEIARYLDTQVKLIKTDNLIRKSIGAPMN